MKRKSALLILAVGLVFGAVSCKSGKHTSCEEAMDNLYDVGCTLTVDQGYGPVEVSEDDAVEGCEDDKGNAKDEGCLDEYYDALDCFADAEECDDCGDEFDDYNDCLD